MQFSLIYRPGFTVIFDRGVDSKRFIFSPLFDLNMQLVKEEITCQFKSRILQKYPKL